MIRLKGLGAVYGEVWYDEEPPGDSGVDIVLYGQRPRPIANDRCVPFLSLVSNLAVAEDTILAGFNKDCRYKIRRAATKDELHIEFIVEPKKRLDSFCQFYESFAQQKALGPLSRQWLVSACEARQLILTVASQNGEALVWHAYLIVQKTARLQYSSSHFRNKGGAHRALVGRANRWLHWKAMLRFKEMGIERYDWGGLFEDASVPERAGINEFKKSFGGQHERTYNCTVPVTIRGRIWLPLRDAWRELMRIRASTASCRSGSSLQRIEIEDGS